MPIQPPPGSSERSARFTGTYRVVSAPHSSLIRIVELFGGYRAPLRAADDGTLTLTVERVERRFVEVEPLYFRQVDGPFGMIFRVDASGRVTHMHTDLMPQYTLIMLKWYESVAFHVALAATCLLLFLSMILAFGVRFMRRRISAGREVTGSLPYRVILAVSVLNVLFVVGAALWGNPVSELHSISPTARVVLGLGFTSSLLTVGTLLFTAVAWTRGAWTLAARVHYTIVTLAAAAFVWFLDYWNLLGWRY